MLTDFLGTTIPRLAAPLFRDVVWRGPMHSVDGKPCLYLTFDDGPHPTSTPQLLDFLNKAEASATFFFTGSQAERFPELVRATIDAGQRVGNHGWTHESTWTMKRADAIASFERTASFLEDLTGQPVGDVRPPYGRFTPALRSWCGENGRRLVLWDSMPGDFLAKPNEQLSQRLSNRMICKSKPGSIVVLHENERTSEVVLPALEVALAAFRSNGWVIATL